MKTFTLIHWMNLYLQLPCGWDDGACTSFSTKLGSNADGSLALTDHPTVRTTAWHGGNCARACARWEQAEEYSLVEACGETRSAWNAACRNTSWAAAYIRERTLV